MWSPEAALKDFETVARLAGVEAPNGLITVEKLPAPHVAPTRLPPRKMAVYVFSKDSEVLKVGKIGTKSGPRYTSQHYNAGSAMSTLAGSILADPEWLRGESVDHASIGRWIRQNVDRVNFLMDDRLGVRLLTLLEAFLQCRLNPRYEGFKSQKF